MKSCRKLNSCYNQRLAFCNVCGEVHWFSIKPFKVDAYNLKWKQFKDYQRNKYAKDLLQPIDKRGKPNEDFYKAYGKPFKTTRKRKADYN